MLMAIAVMSLLMPFSLSLFVAQPDLDRIGTKEGVSLDCVSQVKAKESVTTGYSLEAERMGFEPMVGV